MSGFAVNREVKTVEDWNGKGSKDACARLSNCDVATVCFSFTRSSLAYFTG
jgi:hypothetical protein